MLISAEPLLLARCKILVQLKDGTLLAAPMDHGYDLASPCGPIQLAELQSQVFHKS